MRSILTSLLQLAGGAAVTTGAFLAWQPLGWFVLGGCAVFAGHVLDGET